MWKFIIDGLIIYLLYKVIFDVVVPVSKGVKSVKRNMEQMQRQQAEAFKQAQNASAQSSAQNSSQASNAPKKEIPVEAEYIDFEEVKK
jgi:Sec-independent protein translocase protein TatA